MKMYYINAFVSDVFAGNPAAVCILPAWLDDAVLQSIVAEQGLPIVFLVKENDVWIIRWFGMEYEIPLCGHGTLAAAWVIFNELSSDSSEIIFHSPRAGKLPVRREGEKIILSFPAQTPKKVESSYSWDTVFHATPINVYEFGEERLVAVFEDESMIQSFVPDVPVLKSLPHRAVVITAHSSTVDFVSRTFYPRKKDVEDAVTGSSHCLLAPYWAARLGKTYLVAHQLSARGGALTCELEGDKVLIGGLAGPSHES
jgi:PhzF family phenazine biosynthesis protein